MKSEAEIYEETKVLNSEGRVDIGEVKAVAELLKVYDASEKYIDNAISTPTTVNANGQSFNCVNAMAKRVQILNPKTGNKEIFDNKSLFLGSNNASMIDTIIGNDKLTDDQKREAILLMGDSEVVAQSNTDIDDDFTIGDDFTYDDDEFEEDD